MRTFGAFLAALLFLPAIVQADEGGGWTVKDDRQSQVQAFTEESALLVDQRINAVPNTMVHAGEDFSLPLLPLYDLVACFRFTNPGAIMNVSSGGGVDITVADAQFASGKYLTELWLEEKQKIDLLDSEQVHVVKRLKIHTMLLDAPQERADAIRLMAAACLSGR